MRRIGILFFLSFCLWGQKFPPAGEGEGGARPGYPPGQKFIPSTMTNEMEAEPVYSPDLKYFFVDHAQVKLVIDNIADKGAPLMIDSNVPLPDNVMSAIRKWRFKPERVWGKSTSTQIFVTFPVRRPLSEADSLGRHWQPAKEYMDGCSTARQLDGKGAAAVDQAIARNPADVQSRLVAICYAELHDSLASAAVRLRHARWFAELDPAFEWLGAPGAAPRRELAGTEDYEALRTLWRQKVAESSDDEAILDNATNFLRISDPEAAAEALLKASKMPDHTVDLLGNVYAFAASGVTAIQPENGAPQARDEKVAATPFAVDAREQLLKTRNMRLLFSALNTMKGSVDTTLCRALLDRAKGFYSEAQASCDGGPQSQSQQSEKLHLDAAVAASGLLREVRPSYPRNAKPPGIRGTVKFQATIGQDGKIKDLEMLSGLVPLYDAARDAVLRREYRPITLNGKPVDATTTIDITLKP